MQHVHEHQEMVFERLGGMPGGSVSIAQAREFIRAVRPASNGIVPCACLFMLLLLTLFSSGHHLERRAGGSVVGADRRWRRGTRVRTNARFLPLLTVLAARKTEDREWRDVGGHERAGSGLAWRASQGLHSFLFYFFS